MPVYQVNEDRVSMKPIKSTMDFAEMMTLAPIDLDELERDMLTLEQQSVPVVHHFAPGIYIREARFSAGSFIIGHTHTVAHLNVMLEGHITMATGEEMIAPLTFVGGRGRKACVVHKDTVWMNVYATDEMDIGKLEDMFMDKSDDAKEQEKANSINIAQDVLMAQSDYPFMLTHLGMTAEDVARLSAYEEDRIRLPWGAYRFRSAPSPIHGEGIFASAPIKDGDLIGPANINGKRTVLGYGVNHSGYPNAKMVPFGNGINLIAIRDISGNRGGKLGDEITVDYRESRKVALCLVQ